MMGLIMRLTGVLDKTRAALAPPRHPVWELERSARLQPENISFTTDDGLTLHGWWIEGAGDITVVMAHSFGACRSGWQGEDAAGNSHRIDWRPSIQTLVQQGYNVLAFDHRACGESDGELTYFGREETKDIIAAVDWANSSKSVQKIAIIGYSSGANAALHALVQLENQSGLRLVVIAVSLYWYERMIAKSTKFFTNVPLFMLPLIKRATAQVVGFDPVVEINPVKVITKTKTPVMLVNALIDEIADIEDIQAIYNARRMNVELEILHPDTRFDAYHFVEKHPQKVFDFIDGHLGL